MNRIVEGIKGVRTGVHICRGNWSKKDSVHLAGDYQPLVASLSKIDVQQLVLEFATPRAGDFGIVGETLNDREIGLGVVNPRPITSPRTSFSTPTAASARSPVAHSPRMRRPPRR